MKVAGQNIWAHFNVADNALMDTNPQLAFTEMPHAPSAVSKFLDVEASVAEDDSTEESDLEDNGKHPFMCRLVLNTTQQGLSQPIQPPGRTQPAPTNGFVGTTWRLGAMSSNLQSS